MNTIQGRNQIIELSVSGTFYPVFCCKSFEYAQVQEVVEVTSINSAFSREYVPGMTTATLNVTGITVIDNSGGQISIFYLMQESVRRAIQSMRISLTSDDGGTLQILFNAIITSNTLSRERASMSQSVSGFIVTGVPTLSVVVPPSGSLPSGGSSSGGVNLEIQLPLYIDVVAGQTSVHDALLEVAGVVILEVDRSGVQHDETTGTPGNRQFTFGGVGVGTINFDPTNPFNSGEVIYILYTSP